MRRSWVRFPPQALFTCKSWALTYRNSSGTSFTQHQLILDIRRAEIRCHAEPRYLPTISWTIAVKSSDRSSQFLYRSKLGAPGESKMTPSLLNDWRASVTASRIVDTSI